MRGNARPREFQTNLADAATLLADSLGRAYVTTAFQLWVGLGELTARLPWANLPDEAIIALTLGLDDEAARAVDAVFGPAPLEARRRDILLAYLARTARRRDAGFAEVVAEMERLCLWLYAVQELDRRMAKHQIAMLRFAAAAMDPRPPTAQRPAWLSRTREHLRDIAASEYVRLTAKTLPDPFLHGVLGEVDPHAARQEAEGLVGQRLAEELRRLADVPLEVQALAILAGRMDYHKIQARQAVLRGRRQIWERHVLVEDPESKATPGITAAYPQDKAAEDPERLAVRLIRGYRLRPSEAKVVRFITAQPGAETMSREELARGAGVSLSTVENTCRKLTGDRARVRRILSSF